MLVKHEWTHVPVNWVTLGHPPDGASIDLNIALKPDREKALTDALLEVSQPGSPKRVIFTAPLFEAYSCVPLLRFRYGAHLTKQQVAQLVAPHPDTFELVTSWLKYNGIPPSSISTTHGGSWLTVPGVPVSQANRLLGASYQLFHHPGTNETILRTVRYALPDALHTHVKTITPTTAFTSTSFPKHETPRNRSGAVVNGPSGDSVGMLSRQEVDEIDITPSILRSLYGTTTYRPVATIQNTLGIMGYRNQIPKLMDLIKFMDDFCDEEIDYQLPITRIINELYQSEYGVQATMDVEYGVGLVYLTPVIYYRSSGNGMVFLPNKMPSVFDEYVELLDYLINQPNAPRTLSLGYGTPELSIPWEYADAVCNLFAQLGSRGISILVASGDAGVGLGNCINIYGGVQFYTSFPASCMCGIYSLLASYAQAQVQVDH